MPIKLTRTESKVLDLSLLGVSTSVIGNALGFAHKQATRHLGNIYKKRGVSNRNELMAQEIVRLNSIIRRLERKSDE